MHVVRFHEATFYMAPGHLEMTMLRLQGREAGRSSDLWIGISTIVLDGEVEMSNGQTAAVLAPRDSCRIAPGEDRQLLNYQNARSHTARKATSARIARLRSDVWGW